jgi:N-acetylmuramoyl-L-alanine amidase
MAKQPKTTSEHLISIYGYITGLRRDVNTIKNNHLKHLHTQRGFDTIGYHYLIKRDGTLQTGRDEDAVGAHAVAVNGTSIGIALVGGGTADMGWENNFTSDQFNTLKSIILRLKDKYDIEKIIGHYQVEASKECPSFDVPGWLIENGVV